VRTHIDETGQRHLRACCALPVAAIPYDARVGPPMPPPIVQLVKRKPWLAVKLLARGIPESREPEAD